MGFPSILLSLYLSGVSLLLLFAISLLACRATWLMIFRVRGFFKAIGNIQL